LIYQYIAFTLTATPQTTGDVPQYTVVGFLINGTVAVDDIAASHTVTYTPRAAFMGSDRFMYKATDRKE